MEIVRCEQNSDEWVKARLGLPTASQFSDVLAKGQGKSRRTYMRKLAGERMTGEPAKGFRSADMERGHAMEPEARHYYEFQRGVTVERVGLIKNVSGIEAPYFQRI